MAEQNLQHVTSGRPKINRRKGKKKRKGLRKAFESKDEVKAVRATPAASQPSATHRSESSLAASHVPPGEINNAQLQALSKFTLPTMKIRKAEEGNVLELVDEMEEHLNRLITAEKKIEVQNHILRTDVNLMTQKASKLEEEFCYRYPSAKTDETKVKQFVEQGSRAMDAKAWGSSIRYLQGLVNFHNTRHWKTRYFILTERFLEIHKTAGPPKEGAKPFETYDMGASNISKCMKHHGFDRPCFKLSATNSNRYAMFYANNSNDNQAWYSGVNNRRVQCSYEDQCKQIKAAPSQTVLKFLSQWRFAGDPIKLVMTGENLDVLAAGIIQRCLSDPSNPSNPIAELYLARCSLNEMKMNDICVGLFKNKTVTKLDLSKTLMKPGMAAALAKALEHNYKNGGALQELVLDDSKFEEKGFESLVSGLSKSGLAKLSLQRCALRDDSASALAKGLGTHGEMGRLVDINLSGNFIGDKGAEAIGEGLAQNQVLLSLNLNKNKIGDEGGVAVAEAVRKNTSLQDLYLQGNELGSNASVALTRTAQMSSCLRNLSFGDNKLDRQHMSVMHLLYKYGFAPEKKE